MTPLPLESNTLPPSRLYPTGTAERSRWILARRGPKNLLDPWTPYAYFWEEEYGPDGELISTVTILLTNQECPYRCLMCDLWRNTLDDRVPSGAIAAQIRKAQAEFPPAQQIKLYNAGSFFDPQAIPPEDYPEIAEAVAGCKRVIVECHPRLVRAQTRTFSDLIPGKLEVAVGLETVHEGVLERLNKRVTVADFQRAAAFLAENNMALRAFLMLRPPFLNEREGLFWAKRSLDTALDAGATACCLIPTRGGNGAMESLAKVGEYAPPSLRSLEVAQEYGLRKNMGRIFADLWDIEIFYTCPCSPARAARMEVMNRTQTIPPPVSCSLCEGEWHQLVGAEADL